MNTKHTATLFSISADKTADGDTIIIVSDVNGLSVWQGGKSIGNRSTAEFIVRSCKAHDDLPAVARMVADGNFNHAECIALARAALAKAGAA